MKADWQKIGAPDFINNTNDDWMMKYEQSTGAQILYRGALRL